MAASSAMRFIEFPGVRPLRVYARRRTAAQAASEKPSSPPQTALSRSLPHCIQASRSAQLM
jgi:hypothetical protein